MRLELLQNNATFHGIEDVDEFTCNCLSHLKVKYFGYSVIKPDGSRSILTNLRELLEKSYINKEGIFKYPVNQFGQDYIPVGNSIYYFESDLVNQMNDNLLELKTRTQNIIRSYKEFNIVDRFIITNKTPEYVENYIFCFEGGTSYLSLVINNLTEFSKATHIFRSKANKLITAALNKPIIPPWRPVKLFDKNEPSQKFTYQGMLKIKLPVRSNRLYLTTSNSSNKYLTKKEIHCARLLVHGMSARQIADQNFISRRTVETHISNIKEKLCVNKRSELIARIIDMGIF